MQKRRGQMTTRSRAVLVAASLLLLSVYVFPIWKITLDAPQYPEGLGLYIEVNSIRGANQGNLESINGLNHYIGMKEIHPESIPELKIMPWLFAGLIVLGLGAAAGGRRWMLFTWVGLFLVLAVAGLVDFYLWEYDYGHNLDHERAIIKVPGMTYQPPLIGSKQMLNITATSLPALGGIATFVAGAIGLIASFFEVRARRSSGSKAKGAATALVAAILLSACSAEPRPIAYGEDMCHMCKMVISDARFGAEIVTSTGKVMTFDSIECLTSHLRTQGVTASSVWVADAANPGTLVRAEGAFYLHSEAIMSPMGGSIAGYAAESDRNRVLDEKGGEALTWVEVVESASGGSGHNAHSASAAHHHGSPGDRTAAGDHGEVSVR